MFPFKRLHLWSWMPLKDHQDHLRNSPAYCMQKATIFYLLLGLLCASFAVWFALRTLLCSMIVWLCLIVCVPWTMAIVDFSCGFFICKILCRNPMVTRASEAVRLLSASMACKPSWPWVGSYQRTFSSLWCRVAYSYRVVYRAVYLHAHASLLVLTTHYTLPSTTRASTRQTLRVNVPPSSASWRKKSSSNLTPLRKRSPLSCWGWGWRVRLFPRLAVISWPRAYLFLLESFSLHFVQSKVGLLLSWITTCFAKFSLFANFELQIKHS